MSFVLPALQTIVHWSHLKGGEAHCLVRVYRLPDEQSLILLSAIRSNSVHQGLTLDLSGAANALQPSLEELGILPTAVIWIAHYGQFSHYDAIGQESFFPVNLRWNGAVWEGSLAEMDRLSAATAHQLEQILLTPVFDVLNTIGWTQRRTMATNAFD